MLLLHTERFPPDVDVLDAVAICWSSHVTHHALIPGRHGHVLCLMGLLPRLRVPVQSLFLGILVEDGRILPILEFSGVRFI